MEEKKSKKGKKDKTNHIIIDFFSSIQKCHKNSNKVPQKKEEKKEKNLNCQKESKKIYLKNLKNL